MHELVFQVNLTKDTQCNLSVPIPSGILWTWGCQGCALGFLVALAVAVQGSAHKQQEQWVPDPSDSSVMKIFPVGASVF